jgi:Transposase DDE domain group 1
VATECIAQLGFKGDGFVKPIVAAFDMAHASSDGGAVLLKALDGRLGLTERLAACLTDGRQPGKVHHSTWDLLRQRVFGVALGYADCNDAARVAHDPIHKLLLDRDPLTGAALGSQPTLSRFENTVRRHDLYALAEAVADTVIGIHRRRLGRRARRITLDLDTTEDPTHGQQEFAFFNGYYGHWCYLPLVATMTFNAERQQYLMAALLRPGTGAPSRTALALLRRLLPRLRAAFPRARLRVRLDAGFAGEALLAFLEAEGLEYVVALQGNARLRKRIRRLQGRARRLSRERGRPVRLVRATRYQARRWSQPRRVIMKAEVVWHPGRPPKNNPRFVVTNLPYRPATVYRLYCGRGDVENRLKELHDGLALDRTSCARFRANYFRVVLTAAAFVLFQELQRRAQRTACADAQVGTLRERLLKLAVWVARSVRRIVLHLPRAFPWRASWQHLACALGATP